jgi:hypothetical protein
MGTTFKQVRSIEKTVKKIVARKCREMNAENKSCSEYWKVTCAIASDGEMQELMTDDGNRQAVVAAYLDNLVWDAASGVGDWIDTDDDDARESTVSTE